MIKEQCAISMDFTILKQLLPASIIGNSYIPKAYFGHKVVAFRKDSQSKEKKKEEEKQKAVSKYPMIH